MEQTFEREVLDRLKTIEIKLDGYGELKQKVYENERRILLLENDLKEAQSEIRKQQDENTWTKRTVVAAVVTAVIGILVTIFRIGLGI